MNLMDMIQERTGCRGDREYVHYRATVVDADRVYALVEMCDHDHRNPETARRCARRLLRDVRAKIGKPLIEIL